MIFDIQVEEALRLLITKLSRLVCLGTLFIFINEMLTQVAVVRKQSLSAENHIIILSLNRV